MELKVQERVTRRIKVKSRHPVYPNQTGEQLPVRALESEEREEQVWVRLDSGEVPLFSPWDLEDIA